jgi:hypothetical protein
MAFRLAKRWANGSSAEAQPQPLMKVSTRAACALAELDADLRDTGFGRNCRGLARDLYASFTATVIATRGTEDESIAWAIGRALATDLDALGAGRGALALLDGLTEFGASHADPQTMERLREIREAINQKLELRRTVAARAKAFLSRIPTVFRGDSAPSRRPDPGSSPPKSLAVRPDIVEGEEQGKRTAVEPSTPRREASPQLPPTPSGQAGETKTPVMPNLAEASWPPQTFTDEASTALPGVDASRLSPEAPISEPQPRELRLPASSAQTNEESEAEPGAGATDLASTAVTPASEPSVASFAASIARVAEAPELEPSVTAVQVEYIAPAPPPEPPNPIRTAPMAPVDKGPDAAPSTRARDFEFVAMALHVETEATNLARRPAEIRFDPAADRREQHAPSHEELASGDPQSGRDLTDVREPKLLHDEPEFGNGVGLSVQLEECPAPLLPDLPAKRPPSRPSGEFALATATVLVSVIFYLLASHDIRPVRHSLSLHMRASTSWSVRPAANALATGAPPDRTSMGAQALRASASGDVDGMEQLPSPGQLLSSEEVQYCVFQGRRLDYLRGQVAGSDAARGFRVLEADFNSRCTNSRFQDNALEAANKLAEARLDQLKADADEILTSWTASKFGPLVNLQTRQGAGSIQGRLKALGYFHDAVDGVWGPSSVAALSSFRRQHGFGSDGVWDLATQWALLEN